MSTRLHFTFERIARLGRTAVGIIENFPPKCGFSWQKSFMIRTLTDHTFSFAQDLVPFHKENGSKNACKEI